MRQPAYISINVDTTLKKDGRRTNAGMIFTPPTF